MTVTRRALLTTLGLGLPAAVYAADAPPAEPPRVWTETDPRELFRRKHFPDVTLVTHEGKPVRFYEDLVKDRRVLFNMIYVGCNKICIPVTANLARVQQLLGKRVGRDIHFYSITLEPAHDTPAVLAEYAREHGARRGWTFLTGKAEDIERVRRGLGFVYSDAKEDADKSNHVGMLRFGHEPMIRWATCPGQANPRHIVRSINTEFGWS